MTNVIPGLTVSHVADFYCRYPGEPLTLFTRLDVQRPAVGCRVQIGVPAGMVIDDYSASANHGSSLPDLALAEDKRYLVWKLDGTLQPGDRYEYELRGTVGPANHDLTIESRAQVIPSDDAQGQVVPAESVSISVLAKGRYLKYLPAIYAEEDEFMGRFLMLFESFWGAIEKQVDGLYDYIDPRLAPLKILPWLASWTDLELDSQWPEQRRRELVRRAYQLFRKRGTKQGLQTFLEIYTGVNPVILEHRANDFRLGAGGRLGSATALGTRNRPHTFSVILRLPPVDGTTEEETARKEIERRRTIEAIIETEKPAHTSYSLRIETTPDSTEFSQGIAIAQGKERQP